MVKDLEKVLIVTQDIDDVPFDLRHFRCFEYELTPAGLNKLKDVLTASVKEISQRSYRFSVTENEQYHFPHRLFGPDRCFHDFIITEIWIEEDAVKVGLIEYRHVLGRPVEIVKQLTIGMGCGESLKYTLLSW